MQEHKADKNHHHCKHSELVDLQLALWSIPHHALIIRTLVADDIVVGEGVVSPGAVHLGHELVQGHRLAHVALQLQLAGHECCRRLQLAYRNEKIY